MPKTMEPTEPRNERRNRPASVRFGSAWAWARPVAGRTDAVASRSGARGRGFRRGDNPFLLIPMHRADRKRVFLPFHRLGDPSDRTGVGLGLVVSRGLAEAMGGTVEPEETPGGGLTMVVSLAAVTTLPAVEVGGARRIRAA